MLKIMIVPVILISFLWVGCTEPKDVHAEDEIKVETEIEEADEEDYGAEDEAAPEIDEEREREEKDEKNDTEKEAAEKFIEGVIEEIAEDGSYVIVEGQKIFTSKKYIEQENLIEGEMAIIYAEQTTGGWKTFENTGNDDYSEEDDRDVESYPDEEADGEDVKPQDETDE